MTLGQLSLLIDVETDTKPVQRGSIDDLRKHARRDRG